jgi:hypothetical protein
MPIEWSLVGFGGDERSGNIQLDSADPDGAVQSLHLRWAPAKSHQSLADLETRIAPLLKEAERSARRAHEKVSLEKHPVDDECHVERSASLAFSWKPDRGEGSQRAGQAGIGRIWHCGACGRVVVAQAYCQPGGKSFHSAQEMLAAIECHPKEAGWHTWGLYGLVAQVPADYALAGQQLMNIYLQLLFQRGQSTDQISVEQWSLANVQLKGMYLDEWYEKKCGALMGTASLDKAQVLAHGHPALFVSGKRSGIGYWAVHAPRTLARFKRLALHYAALLWECPQTNKAYLIQSFSRRPAPSLVEEIARRIQCHHV